MAIDTLGDLAIRFAADVLDCERRLVSAGRHDPARLLEVAREHRLAADCFSDAGLGTVFAVLCGAAEVGELPGEFEDHDAHFAQTVRKVAKRKGAEFGETQWRRIWWAEVCASGMAVWARLVRANVDRIARGRDCLREARELLRVDTDEAAEAVVHEWQQRQRSDVPLKIAPYQGRRPSRAIAV